MELDRLPTKKERHCTNCEYCKRHYIFATEGADLEGISCQITNAIVRIVGRDKTICGLLFKQCPLAEKKGEL